MYIYQRCIGCLYGARKCSGGFCMTSSGFHLEIFSRPLKPMVDIWVNIS
uniref:Uncharacterized protein n=1 Tax=Rhizophora mucronata TaxID=61149 RepID=A0A2P2PQK2_RHIMU